MSLNESGINRWLNDGRERRRTLQRVKLVVSTNCAARLVIGRSVSQSSRSRLRHARQIDTVDLLRNSVTMFRLLQYARSYEESRFHRRCKYPVESGRSRFSCSSFLLFPAAIAEARFFKFPFALCRCSSVICIYARRLKTS